MGGDAVARCFTVDAVVTDEGQRHRGTAAMKQRKDKALLEFIHTAEPFASKIESGHIVVTSHVVGNFPVARLIFNMFLAYKSTKSRRFR